MRSIRPDDQLSIKEYFREAMALRIIKSDPGRFLFYEIKINKTSLVYIKKGVHYGRNF